MITLKRILVLHDFSETSEAERKYATELARIFGAKLHVLHVSEPDRTDIPTELALGPEEGMEDALRERLLKTVTGHDKRSSIPISSCAAARRPRKSCATPSSATSTSS